MASGNPAPEGEKSDAAQYFKNIFQQKRMRCPRGGLASEISRFMRLCTRDDIIADYENFFRFVTRAGSGGSGLNTAGLGLAQASYIAGSGFLRAWVFGAAYEVKIFGSVLRASPKTQAQLCLGFGFI
jgi:hypothetical protein